MLNVSILTAVGVLGGLTFSLASLLILANRKFFVFEDPRLDIVENMLPKNNCGGCGYPSCRAFSEALVKSEVFPGKCGVSSESQRGDIADFLKVDVGSEVKKTARLACAGGTNVADNNAHYKGAATCLAANQVGGGGKSCAWGCLGFGDCEKVCEFGAIRLDVHGLPIVDEAKCTACGDCVDICPKELFSLQDIKPNLWIACKNEEMGDVALDVCQVSCTACGRCVQDAPKNLINMCNNLPVIDYFKKLNGAQAIERCPTGAIVWIDATGKVNKGQDVKISVRQSALPETNT